MTPTSNRLSTFFKESDTEFGVFYPKHYILATYRNDPDAEHARDLLRDAGFEADEVIAVNGDEVVQFAQDLVLRQGLWGVVMEKLSAMFNTEATYAEADLNAAKAGAGFVAVHCPTEPSKEQAWAVLRPTAPAAARYYMAGGIEHLAGET